MPSSIRALGCNGRTFAQPREIAACPVSAPRQSAPAGGVTVTSSTAMPGRATIAIREARDILGLHHLRCDRSRAGRPRSACRSRPAAAWSRGCRSGRASSASTRIEAELAGLRRGVAGAVGERAMRDVRADHDDVARAARLHPSQRLAARTAACRRCGRRASRAGRCADALITGPNVPTPAEHTTMSSSGSSREPALDLGLVGDVEPRMRRPARARAASSGPWSKRRPVRQHRRRPRPRVPAAHAAPIPLEPPVTIANLPRSRFTHATVAQARASQRVEVARARARRPSRALARSLLACCRVAAAAAGRS